MYVPRWLTLSTVVTKELNVMIIYKNDSISIKQSLLINYRLLIVSYTNGWHTPGPLSHNNIFGHTIKQSGGTIWWSSHIIIIVTLKIYITLLVGLTHHKHEKICSEASDSSTIGVLTLLETGGLIENSILLFWSWSTLYCQ